MKQECLGKTMIEKLNCGFTTQETCEDILE